MDIWNIISKNHSGLALWRTGKDNFQVIIKGEMTALLTNPHYIVLAKKYTSLLTLIPEQVSFNDVKIIDHVLKTETDQYVELKIKNGVDPMAIKQYNCGGLKIWQYNGHVFVSCKLKEEFLKISKTDFAFNPGLTNFGG